MTVVLSVCVCEGERRGCSNSSSSSSVNRMRVSAAAACPQMLLLELSSAATQAGAEESHKARNAANLCWVDDGKIWFRMSTRFKAPQDKGCSQNDIKDIIFLHLQYFLGAAFIRSYKRTSVWQRAFWVWQVSQRSLFLVVRTYKSSAQQLNFHVHDTSQSQQRHR